MVTIDNSLKKLTSRLETYYKQEIIEKQEKDRILVLQSICEKSIEKAVTYHLKRK